MNIKIVNGPHLLFTGGNGAKMFGVTVEGTPPGTGYKSRWDININTMRKLATAEIFGIQQSEMDAVMTALESAHSQQPAAVQKTPLGTD
jgi:hypothetical protein